MSLASHGRRALRIGLPVVVLLLLAVAVLAWRGQRSATHAAYAGESELAGAVGVNLDAGELADARLPATLSALAQSGARWVRFVIAWDQVEPQPGRFDWRLYDGVFAGLRAAPQLKPVVVLNGAPAWARRPGDADNPLAPPQERADFGAFAAAVARRYGGQVDAYQVWHEPNIAPHWGSRPVSPEDYAGLLREAALQIRAADGDARIVLAALAPNTEPGGANMSDVAFLDALYRAAAQPWFDAVAAQPYGFASPPAAPASPAALNFARATLLREVMVRHGDGAKRVWATAFGWNARPVGGAGPASPWGQVDEAQQADYAGQAVELAATRWPWLGPLIWAANCPTRPAGDPWAGFSLCAPDGRPGPVWAALTQAVAAPRVLPAGDHALDHPAVRYSPGWRMTAAAADPRADGDLLAFDFLGSEAALRVQGGPYWAYYRAWVDGQPAGALPRDESGAAYLVLYDPLAEMRVIPLAQGLAPGRHQMVIEAHGGWGQWALRGIQVRETPPRGLGGWLDWRALLLAAAVAAAAWLWLVGTQRFFRADGHVIARSGFCDEAISSDAGDCFGPNDGPRNDAPTVIFRAGLPDAIWYGLAAALALVCALSRWLPLDLAALAGLGLLLVARPDVSLPLIAFVLPLWPQPKRLAGLEFSLYEILVWLAVAAVVARWSLRLLRLGSPQQVGDSRAPNPGVPNLFGKFSGKDVFGSGSRLRLRDLDWPVLALLTAGLLASLAAERMGVALREFRTVFLLAGLLYALVTRVPWPSGRRFSARPLIYGLLAGMTFVSLVALWQFVTGQGRIDVEGVGRVRAFYGSPNNLALVLDRAIPLGLALAAFGAGRSRLARRPIHRGVLSETGQSTEELARSEIGQSAGRFWARALLGLASGIMLAACIVTYSKGALLLGLPVGLAVVLGGGAWRSRQRWPLWALAGLIVAGGVGLALLTRTPRFADLTNLDAGTGFFRLKLWQSAWNMLLDHPWLGVGPDNFLYAYRTHYVLPAAWQELNLSHPHNIVLDLGTRLGLMGLVAGGWALLAGIRRGWRLLHWGDAATWPLALGLLAGLAATLAHGLIDNSLFLIDLMALFMLALGVLQESGNRSQETGVRNQESGIRRQETGFDP
jgi:O-antigen ligase